MNTTQPFASLLRLGGALVAAAFLTQPSRAADEHSMHDMAAPTVDNAIAVLVPTEGNAVRGIVHFMRVPGGVHVVADVTGLTPGLHGFHVHEFGDASSADGMAAGGHFNPMHETHAGPMAEHRHAGDLGNLEADAAGHATLDLIEAGIFLDGPHSIIGRGLIVHASPDDLKSQPTGNAGKRVACGVIGVAK